MVARSRRDGYFALAVLANGTFTTIEVPGDSVTHATGINDAGQKVGYCRPISQGFVDDRGSFTTIDVPGVAPTELFGSGRSSRTRFATNVPRRISCNGDSDVTFCRNTICLGPVFRSCSRQVGSVWVG